MPAAQLRPLSFGEILDGAFTLYRRHFATLYLTALLPFVPAVLLWIAYPVVAGNRVDASLQTQFVVAGFALGTAGAVLAKGALIQEASAAYLGAPVTRAAGFALSRKRFWALLATLVLWWVVMLIGWLFLFVPAVVMGMMFFSWQQVTVLEGRWGFGAFLRSAALANGTLMRVFGLGTVLGLVAYMPTIAMLALGVSLSMTGSSLAAGFGTTAMLPLYAAGLQILSLLVNALSMPVLPLGVTLLYLDRRVRSEALDLEMSGSALAGG